MMLIGAVANEGASCLWLVATVRIAEVLPKTANKNSTSVYLSSVCAGDSTLAAVLTNSVSPFSSTTVCNL